MSGGTHTLLLRLAGPMQSWGFRSRFDNRDTGLEPTRSGVIGLLCAALGWERGADLTPFSTLTMGVRVDASGRVMVDYHTAQNVLRAGGGMAETVVSQRYYLSDARFLVGLQSGDAEFLRALQRALQNPKWSLFLGRKSFPPSLPVALPDGGLRPLPLRDALQSEPWLYCTRSERWQAQDAVRRSHPLQLRLLLETDEVSQGSAIPDVPRDFATRRFGLRYVRSDSMPLSPENIQKDELCSFPN